MTHRFTIGTHNLHDDGGNASPFADIIMFTEAPKSRAGRRRMRKLLPGYTMKVAWSQRSLIIAWRDGGPFEQRRQKAGRFIRAHLGRIRLTPMRGTFGVLGHLNGEPCALFAEHRINKSYKSHKGSFRRRMWRRHRNHTERFVERRKAHGELVLGGGDTNTGPAGQDGFAHHAYSGLEGQEVGHGLDRLFVDDELRPLGARYLSKNGSDHPRLLTTVLQ